MRRSCLAQNAADFFREDEDVLVALAAEMPRERRHGLRDQLDAVEIELARGCRRRCGSTPPSRSAGSGASMVKPPILATIGGRLVFGKKCFSARVMSMTRLRLLERVAAQAFVRGREVHQPAAGEQLGRVHDEVDVVGAGQIVGRIALHVAVAEMELDEVGLADFQEALRIVIAHRHAPGPAEAVAARGGRAVVEVARKK